MPPKQQAPAPTNRESAEMSEFQQALLAMQENIQSTIHGSIMELGEMLSQRLTRRYPLSNDGDTEDERSVHSNPFARRGRQENINRDQPHDQRWEYSFKVDVPEFHGGPRGEALLDWIATVDEILEYKQVPEEKCVSFVAMKFRGHAASWWKQVKITRHRTGKPPIMVWTKLQKHLKATFLTHNYEHTVYNKLQNLRQGSRSVDDY
uniref:Retrotransposon gag domain-containing protein n=1 Tax=Brassica oleracea var. oleracea TaxID=109376 RepID=A0A0D3CXQ2_BRAOL